MTGLLIVAALTAAGWTWVLWKDRQLARRDDSDSIRTFTDALNALNNARQEHTR